MDSLILRNTALQDGSISCLGTHVRIKDFKIKKKKKKDGSIFLEKILSTKVLGIPRRPHIAWGRN